MLLPQQAGGSETTWRMSRCLSNWANRWSSVGAVSSEDGRGWFLAMRLSESFRHMGMSQYCPTNSHGSEPILTVRLVQGHLWDVYLLLGDPSADMAQNCWNRHVTSMTIRWQPASSPTMIIHQASTNSDGNPVQIRTWVAPSGLLMGRDRVIVHFDAQKTSGRARQGDLRHPWALPRELQCLIHEVLGPARWWLPIYIRCISSNHHMTDLQNHIQQFSGHILITVDFQLSFWVAKDHSFPKREAARWSPASWKLTVAGVCCSLWVKEPLRQSENTPLFFFVLNHIFLQPLASVIATFCFEERTKWLIYRYSQINGW